MPPIEQYLVKVIRQLPLVQFRFTAFDRMYFIFRLKSRGADPSLATLTASRWVDHVGSIKQVLLSDLLELCQGRLPAILNRFQGVPMFERLA